MPLRVGDRVKALTGEEGKIVALNYEETLAYIQVDVYGKGVTIGRLVESLTRIDGEGP